MRVGRKIRDRFFIVSVGCQASHLVFDALDKEKEERLELRVKWNAQEPDYEELEKLVCRLDLSSVANESILCLSSG